jgi:hypothetical protein
VGHQQKRKYIISTIERTTSQIPENAPGAFAQIRRHKQQQKKNRARKKSITPLVE